MTVSLFLWFACHFLLFPGVRAGRYVFLNTTSDHAYYFLNDLGVNVKDGVLIFDITSTQDAILRLSRTQTLNDNNCDVIFGASGNTVIAVRENCGGCGSLVMVSGISLDTVTPMSFWMDWSQASVLKVGQGTSVGHSQLFTYTLTVQFQINYVTATSYTGNEGQWKFTIDTPPAFLNPQPDGSTEVSVPEDTPINGNLLSLSAVDDEGDAITFFVIGEQASVLSVQGTDVILEEELDFEVERSLLVRVTASDGRHNVTATFTLHVTDVKDEAPVVTSGSVTSVQEELAVGTEVAGLFSVSDPDSGDVLTYSLEGSHSVFFSVNETTGTVTVQQRIDREGGLTRLDDLSVKVKDSAGHTSTLHLDLAVDDVNDNRPQFSSDLYTINVTNNTPPESPVLTFDVSDADIGDNSNVSLTLLTTQNPGVWLMKDALYVNVSQMALSAAHAPWIHTVVVQAIDGTTNTVTRLTAVAIVHVQVELSNGLPPQWTSPLPDAAGQMPDLSVREDTPVSSLLLCLSARDDDPGQTDDVIYRMTSAMTAQGQNVSDKFFLDPNSGCLKTASILDSDIGTGGTAYYLMTFRAVDPGSRSAEATMKVTLADVNDNAPAFSQTVYSVEIPCDTLIGAVIASVSATDWDASTNLTFSFKDGDSDFFNLDSVTGEITTKTNVTTMADVSTSHVIDVRVSDGGVPEMTSLAAVVVAIQEGCISASDESDSETTKVILLVACGVLGAAVLTTTVLLFLAKATHPTPVKPFSSDAASTGRIEEDRWPKRTSLNSSRSGVSNPSTDVTVVTDLTDTSSCGSLHFV